MFLGDAANERRRMNPFGGGRCGGRRWSRRRGSRCRCCWSGRFRERRSRSRGARGCGGRSRLCGSGCRCSSACAVRADDGHYGLDGHGLPFGHLDFLQHAGGRRRNLRVHLVGGDLKQRFVTLDLVAGLLQPLGDGAFEDAFAHLGHDHIDCHGVSPCLAELHLRGTNEVRTVLTAPGPPGAAAMQQPTFLVYSETEPAQQRLHSPTAKAARTCWQPAERLRERSAGQPGHCVWRESPSGIRSL